MVRWTSIAHSTITLEISFSVIINAKKADDGPGINAKGERRKDAKTQRRGRGISLLLASLRLMPFAFCLAGINAKGERRKDAKKRKRNFCFPSAFAPYALCVSSGNRNNAKGESRKDARILRPVLATVYLYHIGSRIPSRTKWSSRAMASAMRRRFMDSKEMQSVRLKLRKRTWRQCWAPKA